MTPSSQGTPNLATTPGDRNPPINQVFPEDAFYHSGKDGRVLNVTKPPFNARGDGETDDTHALAAAMRFVRDNYEILRGEGYSLCAQKHNRNWMVYLPDGEYRVSDTVSQGWPALAMNVMKGWGQVEYFAVTSPEHERELYWNPASPPLMHGNPRTPAGNDNDGLYLRGQYNEAPLYDEINWNIRVIGQSRDGTVIRLDDEAPGFGEGADKAVLAFYLLQRGSNVNLGNYCENLSIDTGCGNPGAVGLRWNSSNWGGIRNVAIRSGDGRGRVGLITGANNSTGYHHDLRIEGFDTGIEIAAGRETMVTLEYATLSGQHDTAIHLGDARAGGGGDNLSARKLLVQDAPTVLRAGRGGQAILIESEFRAGDEQSCALVVDSDGFLMARDVCLSGYRTAVAQDGQATAGDTRITEYVSVDPVTIQAQSPGSPPRLPIKEWPFVLPESDLSQWANVDDFGAAGDGISDDTTAVQRAMGSGKPVIYFPRVNYVINGTVDIPATVREVTACFGSIHRSASAAFDGPGLFRVAETSPEPLLIHRAMSAGGVFVDHDADRPLVLEDLYVVFNHARDYAGEDGTLFPSAAAQDTEIWRLYRNRRPAGAPKEVFVNSSVNFGGDNADHTLGLENVRVWARMINTEHMQGALFPFKQSDAWIFGFKAEVANTLLKATDGSRVEVLGGTFLNFQENLVGPVVESRDSEVSAVFLLWHWALVAETILEREQNGETVTLSPSDFGGLQQVDAAVIHMSS